jgi:hypothetical protein
MYRYGFDVDLFLLGAGARLRSTSSGTSDIVSMVMVMDSWRYVVQFDMMFLLRVGNGNPYIFIWCSVNEIVIVDLRQR